VKELKMIFQSLNASAKKAMKSAKSFDGMLDAIYAELLVAENKAKLVEAKWYVTYGEGWKGYLDEK